eukprot:TRINITY_DN1203_c0_g1_i1.p1 TRINITY_DN1203_c0_g1~~TRINITY_DN1203_c0_g1_i1.p1  ORF type:complete len:162 (-),score=20.54 TRINITY_DN1203_c0_g1_i1:688-1173(-)
MSSIYCSRALEGEDGNGEEPTHITSTSSSLEARRAQTASSSSSLISSHLLPEQSYPASQARSMALSAFSMDPNLMKAKPLKQCCELWLYNPLRDVGEELGHRIPQKPKKDNHGWSRLLCSPSVIHCSVFPMCIINRIGFQMKSNHFNLIDELAVRCRTVAS